LVLSKFPAAFRPKKPPQRFATVKYPVAKRPPQKPLSGHFFDISGHFWMPQMLKILVMKKQN
jgi:hypothetical protein